MSTDDKSKENIFLMDSHMVSPNITTTQKKNLTQKCNGNPIPLYSLGNPYPNDNSLTYTIPPFTSYNLSISSTAHIVNKRI